MKVFIDVGLICGVVCVSNNKIIKATEMPTHQLFIFINDNKEVIEKVFLEDAKLCKYKTTKENGAARAQGAGWVKTLATAIEKQLKEYDLSYQLIKPSKIYTKKCVTFVELQTGFKTKANEHNLRDALMMYKFYGF